ncbi:MAG: hypothetical protein AABX04_06150 [Nanoarchaeota archaeon]
MTTYSEVSEEARRARANLVDLMTPPERFSDHYGNNRTYAGMQRFEAKIKEMAKEKGKHVLIAKGIEESILSFFALEIPEHRGEIIDHKYMVLSKADSPREVTPFIVGVPITLLGYHKQIMSALGECVGSLLQFGGGHYKGFPPTVYGESVDFEKFPLPEGIESLLLKLKFHAEQELQREGFNSNPEQVEKLLELPEGKRNEEILNRIGPWLAFISGDSDKVPLSYCYREPFPDIHLIEFGGFDKYFNIVNMGHQLGLSSGHVDLDGETRVRFTGILPKEVKKSLEAVAKSDIIGEAKKGNIVYLVYTVGKLYRLGLLTDHITDIAPNYLPEAYQNFIQIKGPEKPRDIRFNDDGFLKQLAGSPIYDTAVSIITKVVDEERIKRKLRKEENVWYEHFLISSKIIAT